MVENYIQQCKTSGYNRHETREGVISGIKGWKRKHMRRERDKIDFYRGAKSTLAGRVRKKLTEKTNWYKKKRKREDEEEERKTEERSPTKRMRREGGKIPKEATKAIEAGENTSKEEEDKSAISVMFVPFTEGAELAKRVRAYETAAKESSGWFLKVVERGGDSLVDLLHRSDPWAGEDCE